MSSHPSDSSSQAAAEPLLLAEAARSLNVVLMPHHYRLPNGAKVQLDGFNENERILCEVFAHVGEIKPGQMRKLATDMLKLLGVERSLGGDWRKFLCVADTDAERCLNGQSWLAFVVRDFGFKVIRVSLPPKQRDPLLEAQRRQRMVNA